MWFFISNLSSESFISVHIFFYSNKNKRSICYKIPIFLLCFFFINFRQFKLLTRIFSGVIFYQLACGSAFISTTLFQLDLVCANYYEMRDVFALKIQLFQKFIGLGQFWWQFFRNCMCCRIEHNVYFAVLLVCDGVVASAA